MRYRRTFVFLLLLVTASSILIPGTYAGTRVILLIGWTLGSCSIVAGIAGRFGLLSEKVGDILFGLGLVLLGVTWLGTKGVVQQAIPICGDGICSASECDGKCGDCTPDLCTDGTCVPGFERCDTSPDCACPSGTVCEPGADPGANDTRGCTPIVCGDGTCDSGEDRKTCCTECGCLPQYSCRKNVCLFDAPRVMFTTYIPDSTISATSLAANPSLRNSTGRAHPFTFLEVRNEISQAFNVTAHIVLGRFGQASLPVGNIGIGRSSTVEWYGPFHDVLNTTRDVNTTLNITITFMDNQGNEHHTSWLTPITILGRNKIDRFGHPVFFVTPDDVPPAESPKALWRRLQRLTLEPDHPGFQFPAETLQRGGGDADDIGLVFASGLLSSGIKTGLVGSEHGLFVRYKENHQYRIIDPARLHEKYEQADSEHYGYAVWMLPETWEELNATVLSLT